MDLDRRTLLDQWDKARRMSQMPDLPQDVRDTARRAMNHADVALGLMDAMLRAQLKPAQAARNKP